MNLNKLKLLLIAAGLAIVFVTASQAQASPRLEVLDVMSGYPAGSSLPVGLLIHPPEGEGLLAPPEYGGQGPELNLQLLDAPGFSLQDVRITAQPLDGHYHDFVPIKAFLNISPEVEPGLVSLAGRFSFAIQPGQTREFDFIWPINVIPISQQPEETFSSETAILLKLEPDGQYPAEQPAADDPDQAGSTSQSGPANPANPANPVDQEDTLAGYSLGIILLLVFLGGLALNLTPCVYPVIPITISYFVAQAGASRRARLAGALAYWLGMVVMYSALGLFAALGGGILGQALTHPAVIIILVLILLALAASMLGFWEIKMPGKLNQLAATNRRGLGGALLMGLTVGVLAAPCLGPFVLGLMTHVATSGSLLYGTLLFMVLSLGLGLPLAVLAFFSGSITSLPGAGEWMVWVRKFFGIVLIIMAIYVAQPLFSETLMLVLLVLTGLMGGIYLALEKSGGGKFVYFKRIVGLLMVLAALVYGCQNLPDSFSGGGKPPSQVTWQNYSERAVKAAHGKPVLLDFTAAWCQPCRQMERQTFPDPRVQELMKQFTCIKVDVTNGPPNQEAKQLIDKWSLKGVPTFMFLDRKGNVMAKYTFVGFVDANSMAHHLQQVLHAASK